MTTTARVRWGQRSHERRRIHEERCVVDIDEPWPGADCANRERRVHGGVGDRCDLVSGGDTGGAERKFQRIGAAGHPDGVRYAAGGRELGLECGDLGAQHVAATCLHPTERFALRQEHFGVRAGEVVEWDAHPRVVAGNDGSNDSVKGGAAIISGRMRALLVPGLCR